MYGLDTFLHSVQAGFGDHPMGTGAVYKTEINERGNPLRWPRDTLSPQKLALNSPTSGGRSV
jgi:hypothetical protein